MKFRALIGLSLLGSWGCGAGDMEDIEVTRSPLNIATGADFKSKLTADPNGSFTLTADIDMKGAALQVAAFNGVLDGAGHTIKNVTQQQSSSSGDAGIFGTLRGTVKNLKLDNVKFKALSAGGLASQCSGVRIQSVTVTNATVEAGANAGGICGSINGSVVTGSSASGSVKSTSGFAGGLIGSSAIGRSGLGPAISSSSVASMTVTGGPAAGGLVGYCQDAVIVRAAVDAVVSGKTAAGGLCGEMNGGSINNSYAKGSNVSASAGAAGGLVGKAGFGVLTEPTDRIEIVNSYAQYTNVNASAEAGGILGTGQDPYLLEVYAVGNIAGTGAVGGLIGRAQSVSHGWTLNNGVFRGGVVNDTSRPWAGVVGVADVDAEPAERWALTLFDSSLDGDPYLATSSGQQKGVSTNDLKSPTSSMGGVYCFNPPDSTRCGDSAFPSERWDAGNSNQHHILKNMPGPNSQPR